MMEVCCYADDDSSRKAMLGCVRAMVCTLWHFGAHEADGPPAINQTMTTALCGDCVLLAD